MTDDRSLERAARSWLENGPTQAPQRAVDAALLRIESTPQERDLRILRRFTQMSMPVRLATAAAIGVLVVGGALYLLGRPQQNVGAPGPSPSASPTGSPTAPARLVSVPAPDRAWGDWQASLDAPLSGIPGVSGRIQLSIDRSGGGDGSWIQTEAGSQILVSALMAAPAGEIDLIATGSGGCIKGDLGRYSWNRSSDGMFLTLTAIDDACSARAEAYSRAWVHSLTAVNDGGLGVFPIDGWLQMMLPSMAWGLSDTELHTVDDGDPAISFVVVKDPLGYGEPCGGGGRMSVPGTTSGGAASLSGYAEYLRALPGFDGTATDSQVDGHRAVHVKLAPKPAYTCSAPIYALFQDGAERDVATGLPHSLWVVDVNGSTYIAWYEGDGVTAADEQAVISSMKFLDKLPAP
jgi:hypothetical protein